MTVDLQIVAKPGGELDDLTVGSNMKQWRDGSRSTRLWVERYS